jgi:hypothetical protein
LKSHTAGGQRRGVQVLHLVDQEQRAHLAGLGNLPDLPEESSQVLFGIA